MTLYNVAQNSWNYEFFNDGAPLDAFDPNLDGNYEITPTAYDASGAVAASTTIQVLVGNGGACHAIDLRPNNEQNQVNTGANQLVSVPILGAAGFDPCDATDGVDDGTLLARGASPRTTRTRCEDVNGDGWTDMLVYFRARDLEDPSEAECADPDAVFELSGSTVSGQSFAGSDSVTWLGCNRAPACGPARPQPRRPPRPLGSGGHRLSLGTLVHGEPCDRVPVPRRPAVSEAHRPQSSATLTAALVAAEHEQLAGRVAAADAAADAEAWNSLQADWNALKVLVHGEGSRRRHRFSQDTRDAEAEAAEREFREQVAPAAQAGDSTLVAALLASPHREAVAERHGRQLLRVLEADQPNLAPVNSDLRVETSGIARDYDKLLAGGEVTVRGEAMTLARARGKLGSSDGELRREAFETWSGWFVERRDEFAALFDSLVEKRDLMGRNLGHEDFVPLGYAGMLRTDYGPAESSAFREAVLKHASPLHESLCREQAAALGTETLRPWDRGYHPGFTLPTGAAEPVSEQLDKAGRVFARLSPRLAAHFERMSAENLIDLENRPGKAAGAYCTSFPDAGQVAIFCNSIGDEGDVKTLMHEMGHAFQGWESLWIDSVDLRSPSLDACEVHSMGMEFLSLPHLDEFFSAEDCERFARGRWARGIQLLCYVSVVDAFQHWIYENPKASADERDACWVELQDRFMPGIDWAGEAERHRAARWYAQPHVFRRPFYYLDYAIAETGAMQLALLDAQDHESCLETYLELCRLGGTRSVLELFAGAGLRSPFEPAVIADLMQHAGGVLRS